MKLTKENIHEIIDELIKYDDIENIIINLTCSIIYQKPELMSYILYRITDAVTTNISKMINKISIYENNKENSYENIYNVLHD